MPTRLCLYLQGAEGKAAGEGGEEEGGEEEVEADEPDEDDFEDDDYLQVRQAPVLMPSGHTNECVINLQKPMGGKPLVEGGGVHTLCRFMVSPW